ncbi:MAG: sulfatase [Anaerolineae bacterium]|nr:sulfatase [Anaerolineae bacterium]
MHQQPDIFLIVLDTVRADRLSSYGYHRRTTPHIDAFARDGVLFERAISPAQWTIPSHASLFSGEYPTTHMTTQIYDKYSQDASTLAEILQRHGYQTIGFCDNPLLGVLENDLDRGIEEMYNYGGTLPNRPDVANSRPRRVGRAAQHLSRLVRRTATVIQEALARSPLLLRIVMHPWVAPLWLQSFRIKGNTVQLLHDTVGYLRARQSQDAERPLFTFINLMETHLPYRPRKRFVRKFAPYFRRDHEARDFIQDYNLQHYRWMVPLREPLTELQDRVINDLYDAELAYEDRLLRHLFSYLDEPKVRDNTLVIITSDHGEGLNHHDFVGHSLVAYDDLTRVPLIVRYPKLYPQGKRISTLVSTRRVFHSALEAAGIDIIDKDNAPANVKGHSLARLVDGEDCDQGIVYTEAYTPDTLIALMENDDPAAIDTYRCRSMRRAVYRDQYKLITVGDEPDELFDLIQDPGELVNLAAGEPAAVSELNGMLDAFREAMELRRPANWEAARLRLEDDKKLEERLRGLGYLG